jgi:hypothetical protein
MGSGARYDEFLGPGLDAARWEVGFGLFPALARAPRAALTPLTIA